MQVRQSVLVVDDLEDNRNLLVRILEGSYAISEAVDGYEALAQIQAKAPDLVLLDLTMPRLDGFGVLKALAEAGGPFLPVVVVTAAHEHSARMEALRLGAQEFLTKPIDPEELAVRVRTLLALKEARDRLEATNANLTELVAERTAELVRGKAFVDRLLHAVPAAIAYMDAELRPGLTNEACVRALGPVAAGAPAFGLPELGALVKEACATQQPRRALDFPVGEGDAWWDLLIEPFSDGHGAILLGTDASERRERERMQHELITRLRELDRLKDEFMAVVSHELRTPLHCMLAFCEELRDELIDTLSPEHEGYFMQIESGGKRMQRLISDLLDISQIRAGRLSVRPVPAVLEPLLEEVVAAIAPLAEEHGVTLSCEVNAPLPVEVDEARLAQVLTNLIDNAIKFTPAGGRIALHAHQGSEELVLEVTDTGPGIAPEVAPRIFEPFYQGDMSSTRAYGGTGLGLAIARAIVEAHCGRLEVESRPQAGSTFRVHVPNQRPKGCECRAEASYGRSP